MNRKFNIGDYIFCTETGVRGHAIQFYTPTACEEQTMVITDDTCSKYHAPTSTWRLYLQGGTYEETILCRGLRAKLEGVADESSNIHITVPKEEGSLNPYGKYVLKFAENHCLSMDEAYAHPMVKARKEYYDATGC